LVYNAKDLQFKGIQLEMALKEEEEEKKNFTKLPKFPQQKGIADTKTNKKKY